MRFAQSKTSECSATRAAVTTRLGNSRVVQHALAQPMLAMWRHWLKCSPRTKQSSIPTTYCLQTLHSWDRNAIERSSLGGMRSSSCWAGSKFLRHELFDDAHHNHCVVVD